MSEVKLPGGGKAWFLRYGKGSYCGLRPASVEGRLLTAFFAAVVTAVSLYFSAGDPAPFDIAALVVLILASTILFIVTALRMSAPAPAGGREKAGCF